MTEIDRQLNIQFSIKVVLMHRSHGATAITINMVQNSFIATAVPISLLQSHLLNAYLLIPYNQLVAITKSQMQLYRVNML